MSKRYFVHLHARLEAIAIRSKDETRGLLALLLGTRGLY